MSMMTQEVRSDFADRSRDAEGLLMEICREGRTELLTSERAFLAREMSWDELEIKKQLRRVNAIMRLQAIAGRPEDREAALNECQTATDLHAKRAPKIRDQIAKLESELSGLERDASTAQKRVTAQAEAVQQLRQYVPPDVKESVQVAIRGIEAGIGQDLRNAQARHHELRCVLNINSVYESAKQHIEFGLRNLLPAAVSTTVQNSMISHGYSPKWPALKAECEREFSELSSRLPELQAEYDEAIRQAELPLEYYADPKNQEND